MTDYKALEQAFGFELFPKRDLVLVRGKNAKVWDQNGREYVDCVSGNGVANVGHCNDKVIEAVSSQAAKLITCPGIFYNDVRSTLLERLAALAPGDAKRVFLCNSGAESVEAALKFARYTTGKTEIVCAVRGFHGRTMGALSATFNPKYRADFQPLVPGFHHVPFNNFEKLKSKITDATAAVLLEVVQGEGGVHVATHDYLRNVAGLCRDSGVLLIIDEVQSGFCRTGKMFACNHFDLQPDMICLAKAIAGGLPMGALLCNDKIQVAIGKHGTTFGGNPLACAAANAAIDFMLADNLAEQAREKGDWLVAELRRQGLAKVREIRHLGLMIGIELQEKVKPFIFALLEDGVLALPAGAKVLRLLPPLTITRDELKKVAQTLTNILG